MVCLSERMTSNTTKSMGLFNADEHDYSIEKIRFSDLDVTSRGKNEHKDPKPSLPSKPPSTEPPKQATNKIRGSNHKDRLIGTNGSDEIYGYSGNDVLIGKEGYDYLHGGEGIDYFKLKKGRGFATIGDMNPEDWIHIKSPFRRVSYETSGNNMLIYREDDLIAEVTGMGGKDLLHGGGKWWYIE